MPEEIKLIQPAPVVRDENGMFSHPEMPDFDEGEGEGDKCKTWIAEQRLEVAMVSLEYADEAIANRYFESHDPNCSYWEPDQPAGEGWFCLAIHDTDDGPVCWWGRRRPEEVWSLNGDNGSWDYPSLAALIRDNYGHDCDSDGPMSDGGTLVVGSEVHRGIVCKEDPAKFLPDADDVANHMFEQASCSDAGEWVDNYPDLNPEAEKALKQALEPLKAWARLYCQPKFFTVKNMTTHELTEEDVRDAMATEVQP